MIINPAFGTPKVGFFSVMKIYYTTHALNWGILFITQWIGYNQYLDGHQYLGHLVKLLGALYFVGTFITLKQIKRHER